jgi:hypothetical protein
MTAERMPPLAIMMPVARCRGMSIKPAFSWR